MKTLPEWVGTIVDAAADYRDTANKFDFQILVEGYVAQIMRECYQDALKTIDGVANNDSPWHALNDRLVERLGE